MADEKKNVQQEVVFHYSRERRLRNASPEIQALNDGQITKPRLRKTLFGNRGNVMMLICIVVVSVFGLVINFINREPSGGSSISLGGNNLALGILRVEETLILGIIKNAPESGEVYIGDVEIAVSPALNAAETNEDPQVYSHRVLFRPLVSETFHISLPFEGNDFFAVLRAGDEQRSMRLRVVDAE